MEQAILITFLSGICTSLGAAIIFFAKKITMPILAFGMSFSAGVMIYVSFVELLPLSMNEAAVFIGDFKAKLLSICVFGIGAIFAALIDYFIPNHFSGEVVVDDEQSNSKNLNHKTKRMGILLGLAVMLHNFPEGLAVFSTTSTDLYLGISIAVAIALHNIPEGLIIALPIYASEKSKTKAFLWATLSGLTEPLGALFGYFLLSSLLGGWLLATLNALVSGIMVYIALDELLPMAKEYGQEHFGILGVFVGMLFIAIITALIG